MCRRKSFSSIKTFDSNQIKSSKRFKVKEQYTRAINEEVKQLKLNTLLSILLYRKKAKGKNLQPFNQSITKLFILFLFFSFVTTI